MGVEFIWSELSICYPCIGKSVWKAGIDNDDSVPETSVVSTDVANNCDTSQPTAHILKLWNGKTTADSLLGGTVGHVAVKFGKCSHICNLHCFPYWRHGGLIVFLKMFLDKLIFGTVQLFLQVSEISYKQIAALCQRRVHKPEGTMPFRKDAYHSGSNCYLYMLNSRKKKYAQLFVEAVKTQYLGESGTWLEDVILPVSLHQSPIACQAEVADDVKSTLGFFFIFNKKPSLLKNVNLLLEGQQLLGISHNRINKKCPALVRCIPCGREAVAGSIACKGTAFNRNSQTFCRKSE